MFFNLLPEQRVQGPTNAGGHEYIGKFSPTSTADYIDYPPKCTATSALIHRLHANIANQRAFILITPSSTKCYLHLSYLAAEESGLSRFPTPRRSVPPRLTVYAKHIMTLNDMNYEKIKSFPRRLCYPLCTSPSLHIDG